LRVSGVVEAEATEDNIRLRPSYSPIDEGDSWPLHHLLLHLMTLLQLNGWPEVTTC
jgi:hypothetical protein